jgi:alpha-glucosidase
VWLPEASRFAQYLRADELHTAFNFDFMTRPWQAGALRASIEATLGLHHTIGAPPTWVLSNHDVTRPVTRYGRADSAFSFATKRFGTPSDLALGTRRARAAALLTAALPGSLYLYQGDELGLPEVELPVDAITDPMHERSGGVDPGRDGCRVPLPWTGSGRSFGFSPGEAQPWLPQPSCWGELAVSRQLNDPCSMLALYQSVLARRRSEAALATDDFAWVDAGENVLWFRRGTPDTGELECVVNFGPVPLPLPRDHQVLVSSQPMNNHQVEPDVAVWLRPSHQYT